MLNKNLIKSLKKTGQFSLKAHGTSMLPLLQPGDILIYKKIFFKQIKVNDLIVVEKSNIVYTHRVIYRSSNYLITKGDDNKIADGKIYQGQIIGKVSAIKRNGRLISPDTLYLFQSSVYFDEIINIKNLFYLNRIDYVFLKGVPLHLYYEKTHSKNYYADCDILIEKKQANTVDQILINAGYVKENLNYFKDLQKFIGSHIKTINYFKKKDQLSVFIEIHYEITFLTHQTPSPYPFMQKIINDLTKLFLYQKRLVTIEGNNYPILSKENFIMYLLLHFFAHSWSNITKLDFINTVIKKGVTKKEWQNIFYLASKNKLINFIIPGIYLLKKYYSWKKTDDLVRSLYPLKYFYALMVYRLSGAENYLFNTPFTHAQVRLRRAILILLATDENFLIKLFYLIINPKFVLHFVSYISNSHSKNLKKRLILF